MATPTHRRRTPPAIKTAATPKPAAAEAGPVLDEVGETGATEAPENRTADDTPQPTMLLGPVESDRLDFVDTLIAVGGDYRSGQVEYGDLLQAVRNAGWFLQLREIMAIPQHDGGTLVSFQLLMGTSPAYVQEIDRIALSIQGGTSQPSLVARLNAYPSIVMTLFNIVPPAPVAPVEAPEQGQQAPAPAATATSSSEPLDLVESRTADGIPLYYNPFELSDDPDEVLESFVASLKVEVPRIQSSQGLTALWGDNVDMFDYVTSTRPELADTIRMEILNPRAEELFALESPPAPARTAGGGRRPTVRR